jgi:hypothetical protein
MSQAWSGADDPVMEDTRRVVLQLEVTISDQQPITGTARTRDGSPHPFSGWSEMFAVLQTLTAAPGGDAETEAHA